MTRDRATRPSSDYTLEEKQELVGPGVTLNGKAATVGGARNEFATVTRIADRLSAEFAWGTIEHARNGGAGTLHT